VPRQKSSDISKEVESKSSVGTRTAHVATLMIFGRFVSLFISGIAFILIARILGPDTYGIYTLAAAYASIAMTICLSDLGVSTAFNKFIGQYFGRRDKSEVEKVLSSGYAAILIYGTVISIIAFSLSGLFAPRILGSSSLTYILEAASFTIVLAMLFGMSYNALVGFGKGMYVAIIIILQSAVQSTVSVSLALLKYGAIAPIMGLIIGYTCSIIAAILIFYTKFGVRFRMPELAHMKELLGFSYPIAIYNNIKGFTIGLSPILLGIFTTAVIVGNFGVAIKSGNIMSNVTDALGLAIIPTFAYTVYTKSLSKNIGKFYNYAAYFTYLLLLPALLYIAVLSKQFSYTLFSAKYLFAPGYLSIISVGLLIWVIATYTTALLISSNKVKAILKYGLIITAVEISLVLLVVPHFGGAGLLTILYIVTPTITCMLMARAAKRFLSVRLEVKRLARLVAAALISAALLVPLLLLSNYVLVLVIGAIEQVAVYPIIVALTGAVKKEELRVLRQITSNMPFMNRIIALLANYSERFARG